MISMYCRDHHDGSSDLCESCTPLWEYAEMRLEKCPYGEGKTSCLKCSTHCYKKDMKEAIRHIMRYAGPRMITRHPIMALWHIVDGFRKNPLIDKL